MIISKFCLLTETERRRGQGQQSTKSALLVHVGGQKRPGGSELFSGELLPVPIQQQPFRPFWKGRVGSAALRDPQVQHESQQPDPKLRRHVRPSQVGHSGDASGFRPGKRRHSQGLFLW